MKIVPTKEDIEDAKGYPAKRILSDTERALKSIRSLRKICGDPKLWAEVCPRERKIAGEGKWVDWLDLADDEREEEIRLTAEYLARKKGWIKTAKKLKMPGGWMLSEAFEQVPGYRPGYFGNPITPMSSPVRMQNWGWAVWRRARQILQPYGWCPSRDALEAALISHAFGPVGKIAVRVASASLPVMFGGGLACNAFRGHNARSALWGLRQSRATLVKARGWGRMRKRWDHDQEVIRCISEMVRYHGYNIEKAEYLVVNTLFCGAPILDDSGTVRSPLTGGKLCERVCIDHDHGFPSKGRVRKMDRPPRWGMTRLKVYSCSNAVCSDYHTENGPRSAVRAWKKQIKAYLNAVVDQKKLTELIDRADGATTIVSYQDSRDCGNCHSETMAWGARRGYKNYAPLAELIKDERYEARRLVNYVVTNY